MSQSDSFLHAAQQMVRNKSQLFEEFLTEGGCKITGCYDGKTLLIYYIFVQESLRNTGLVRAFCNSLHTLQVESVAVLAVQSSILDEYLQRFVCPHTGRRFTIHGSDFVIRFAAE
jgi:hypothetical protein